MSSLCDRTCPVFKKMRDECSNAQCATVGLNCIPLGAPNATTDCFDWCCATDNNIIAVVAIVVSVVVVAIVACGIFIVCYCCRKRKEKKERRSQLNRENLVQKQIELDEPRNRFGAFSSADAQIIDSDTHGRGVMDEGDVSDHLPAATRESEVVPKRDSHQLNDLPDAESAEKASRDDRSERSEASEEAADDPPPLGHKKSLTGSIPAAVPDLSRPDENEEAESTKRVSVQGQHVDDEGQRLEDDNMFEVEPDFGNYGVGFEDDEDFFS